MPIRPALPPWTLPLLLVLGFMAHLGALHAGWLEDDRGWIREDAAVLEGVRGIPAIVADGRSGPTSEGRPERPLTRISFAAERALAPVGEPQPALHHAGNLVLHLLAIALLFGVLRRQAGRGGGVAGAAAAGLFAVHPLLAPSVTALAGRAELLALVLLLACTWAWQRAAREGALWWLPACLFLLLATFAHEDAVAWPVVLFALGPPVGAPRPRMAGRRAVAVFLAPVLVVLALDPARASGPAGLPAADLATNAGVILLGLGRTALHFVLPVALRDGVRGEAVAAGAFDVQGAALCVAVLVGLAGLVLLGRLLARRGGPLERALLAYVLFGVVTGLLDAPAAGHEMRWAYLGAVPLFAAAGWCVAALLPLGRRARPVAVLAAGVVLVALGFLTHRVSAWSADEVARLHHRLDLDPDDVLALEGLSTHHRREAEIHRAAAALLPASDPRRGEHNIAATGHLSAALSAARRATEHPVGYRRSRTWASYGLALLASGRPPDALPWLQRAAHLDPRLRDPQALARHTGGPRSLEQAELFHAIGLASQASGLPEEALEPFLFAALLAPEHVGYLRRAGLALNAAGRYPEGLAHLERAWRAAHGRERAELVELLQRERASVAGRADLHLQQGHRARDAGDYLEARRAYEAALTVDPDLVEGLVEAGWLAGWHFGRYEEGLGRLERAEAVLRRSGVKGGDPALSLVARRREELIGRQREDDARLAREEAAGQDAGAASADEADGSAPPR